jgi:enamine deaminase RidA (YjgF/YER057c/UK114 family)
VGDQHDAARDRATLDRAQVEQAAGDCRPEWAGEVVGLLGPVNADGSVAGPLGRVGGEVSPEDAYQAARRSLISILASLKAKIGDLDQIVAWVRICGLFVPANGFIDFPQALNGASDLLQEVFGPEIGDHARLAIGVAALPFNAPLEIEGEVELA